MQQQLIDDIEIEKVYQACLLDSDEIYENYTACILAAIKIYHDNDDVTIVAEAEADDYQGDTHGIARSCNPNKRTWYFYNYGWGSCSGCDMLEGEGHIETIKNLRTGIVPIPLETISITKYIENEKENTWNKELMNELLWKWLEYRDKCGLDDYGRPRPPQA